MRRRPRRVRCRAGRDRGGALVRQNIWSARVNADVLGEARWPEIPTFHRHQRRRIVTSTLNCAPHAMPGPPCAGCEGKTWLTQDLSTGALWAVKMVKLPLHTKMVQVRARVRVPVRACAGGRAPVSCPFAFICA